MNNSDASMDRFRLLIGHPPIQDFVRFIKARSVNGERIDDIALTQRWRAGNAHIRHLAASEARYADIQTLAPLPNDIAAAAEAMLRDPAIQKALGLLPFSWAWVELDRLVVWQQFVEQSFTDRLRRTFPSSPGPHDLLKICAGQQQEPPPVQVITVNRNKFTFSSMSTDLRVLGAVPLDPKDVRGYQPYGHALSVIGVYVGYSINLMMAAWMNNRLMLTNGTHRAYALRALGITHVPCVVSHISTSEDVDLLGLPGGRATFESRLAMQRPPLLKDFFDDQLSMSIVAPRNSQLVKVELNVEHAKAPIPEGPP